jgi:hypothetical protein
VVVMLISHMGNGITKLGANLFRSFSRLRDLFYPRKENVLLVFKMLEHIAVVTSPKRRQFSQLGWGLQQLCLRPGD